MEDEDRQRLDRENKDLKKWDEEQLKATIERKENETNGVKRDLPPSVPGD